MIVLIIEYLIQRISLFELHQYVYARQFYLLSVLNRPTVCAKKSYNFITYIRSAIDRRILTSIQNPKASDLSTETASSSALSVLTQRKQADMFVVCACVKIVQSCRELLLRTKDSKTDIQSDADVIQLQPEAGLGFGSTSSLDLLAGNTIIRANFYRDTNSHPSWLLNQSHSNVLTLSNATSSASSAMTQNLFSQSQVGHNLNSYVSASIYDKYVGVACFVIQSR
jgi:hypothetical protein